MSPPAFRQKWMVMTLCCVVLIALVSGAVWGAGLLPQAQEANHGQATPTAITAAQSPAISATSTTHTPVVATPTVKPSPTSFPEYPALTGRYTGRIINQYTTPSTDANMTLSQLQQEGKAIRGYFSVGTGLVGNGNFAGAVTLDNKIQFLVPGYGGLLPLFFTGQIQQSGSISGSYCSYQDNHCNYSGGGHGVWHVAPS